MISKYNRIISVFLFVFAISCHSISQSKTNQLESKLKQYIVKNFIDSASILDDFKLIKIDTFNEKKMFQYQIKILNIQLESLGDRYRKELYNTNLNSKNYLTGESELFQALRISNIDSIYNNLKLIKSDKSILIKFEIDTVSKVITKLNSKLALADTLKPLGFQALCSFNIKFKGSIIKKDTIPFLVNLKEELSKDFLRLPYIVDITKLD